MTAGATGGSLAPGEAPFAALRGESPPNQLYFKTVVLLSRQRLWQQGEASPIKHQKRPLQ